MEESQDNIQYTKYLDRFEQVVSAMTALSKGSAGIPSPSSRHYWASVIFTRLTGSSVSLLLILPRNRLSIAVFENWDFSAVASLARNICECCFAYFYLCADETGKDEWYCRWNIFNLHDCMRRLKLFHYLGSTTEEINVFETQADELRSRLMTNSYFNSFPERVQQDCLKARKLYLLSQDDILKKMGIDIQIFRGLYILWSSHVHSFPMGYYRTFKNNRGTGVENPAEKHHICVAIEMCIKFIRCIAKAHLHLFPESAREIPEEGRQVLFGNQLF
jgi:hypothetical protein